MKRATPKPVVWLADTRAVLKGFPRDVQDEIGYGLYLAQIGEKYFRAKPLTGFGPGVLEIVSDHRGGAYRGVYTVRFTDSVYVLHVFQKKSKKAQKRHRRKSNCCANDSNEPPSCTINGRTEHADQKRSRRR